MIYNYCQTHRRQAKILEKTAKISVDITILLLILCLCFWAMLETVFSTLVQETFNFKLSKVAPNAF